VFDPNAGAQDRQGGFLAGDAASALLVGTDSVRRGRFISLSMLAINFFPAFGFLVFIIERYTGRLQAVWLV